MSNNAIQNPLGKMPRCNNSSFGTAIKKIGNDAAYFDGSSYLSVPDDNDWEFGTGAFTVDFWVKFSTVGGQVPFIAQASSGSVFIGFEYNGASALRMISYNTGYDIGITCPFTPSPTQWYHIAFVRISNTDINSHKIFINGVSQTLTLSGGLWTAAFRNVASTLKIGGDPIAYGSNFNGYMDEVRICKGIAKWTSNFTPETNPYTSDSYTKLLLHFEGNFNNSGSLAMSVTNNGTVSTGMGTASFREFQKILMNSVNAGRFSSKEVVSTYSLVYTNSNGAYNGGVLAPNGDIHFIPMYATVGQKVSLSGTVSTYSLIYTLNSNAYWGGVLASNGDIYFVPWAANRGQKVSASGVVSTYSLVYTTSSGAYVGGVLAPNGDIHFVPYTATVGQKINSAGVVSTYSLAYTTSAGAYAGGVLAPNGDIYFVPLSAPVGQKISVSGIVSTYSLVHTTIIAYWGGVLSSNGDIHFVPCSALVGQKISSSGAVSTYSLVYTTGAAYSGGVLSPNGDIYFVPGNNAVVGQKISASGIVSTYSLVYTVMYNHGGGVLNQNGDIYFVPYAGAVGQKISTSSCKPFDLSVCCSPFLNKF